MWRYGFNNPPNFNDHEIYCGGFTRQWQTNKGQCGICGDPYDETQVWMIVRLLHPPCASEFETF